MLQWTAGWHVVLCLWIGPLRPLFLNFIVYQLYSFDSISQIAEDWIKTNRPWVWDLTTLPTAPCYWMLSTKSSPMNSCSISYVLPRNEKIGKPARNFSSIFEQFAMSPLIIIPIIVVVVVIANRLSAVLMETSNHDGSLPLLPPLRRTNDRHRTELMAFTSFKRVKFWRRRKKRSWRKKKILS